MSWLLEALARGGEGQALWSPEGGLNYSELLEKVEALRQRLRTWPGRVFAFQGGFSAELIVRLLALFLEERVAVPLAPSVKGELEQALDVLPLDGFWPEGTPLTTPPQAMGPARHPLLDTLSGAGLVILTSGSTGRPKLILHDVKRLFAPLMHPRNSYRVLSFLLPDHMGGIQTLMGTLTSGGCLIPPGLRDPEGICARVEAARVSLLPVTPSFLNLLLLSEAWRRFDCSSLRVISYGTEVMPEQSLKAAVRAFPGVRFLQLYGSSELGILRSRSEAPDSPWMRFEGVELRVDEGRLWLRGPDSMLGYLSGEPRGFDAAGWYDTGDRVEQRGEWLRILGRELELINVGGQKVYPAEVEEVLLSLEGVKDCVVYGSPHPLMGQVPMARVSLSTKEGASSFKRRMRQALRTRLEPYKIPVRVERVESVVGRRFKRVRGAAPH